VVVAVDNLGHDDAEGHRPERQRVKVEEQEYGSRPDVDEMDGGAMATT